MFQTGVVDACCGFVAGLLANDAGYGGAHDGSPVNFWFSFTLPLIWIIALELAGAYDPKFIGVGSDEFRRVVQAGICLTAAVCFLAYVTKTGLARSYVVVAMPALVALDLVARFWLRKRLHWRRAQGSCLHKVVLVGHQEAIADLAAVLRRDSYHGLSIVAACVLGTERPATIAGIPLMGGLSSVADVVKRCGADTVAVLACQEMIGSRLRDLAWALEKTGTDLCVAPALLDVAGPRTTIRPIAGLPLLHVDHPEFSGMRRVIKEVFDRVTAFSALVLLLPVLAAVALTITLDDHGPVLFRQTRVGKDGRPFTLYKFRTMVVDAEQRKAQLLGLNDCGGVLFKMRKDPRVTRVGTFLRRYSLDELPQFVNVLIGTMSLVGPRPALPSEAVLYGDHMRRRLAVKPGITGLWQVNGRSDLSWEEAECLDVRYVENWSLVLDLQILWKTWAVVLEGAGAY